ncbi:hypothetical protein LVB77_10370 [Lysobacter sp. 5GHs7-4]|uniref:hypothetical protein n=1 Tax=Lysobacter sp. 5GHs7-4 TaxID=2904253 RepID=UPI001E35135D|nr:hypothetical protein [Lysobacter sp. 5GHs7-4]UHQ25046.1 hypothetical protein LVB77_10370 [Lysobacter sp. 5GHs7-4]
MSKGVRWAAVVVLAIVVTVVLVKAPWWKRREATVAAPAEAGASHATSAVSTATVGGDDPAAELQRARQAGAIRRGEAPTRSYDLPRGRAVDVVAALRPRAEAGDADAAFYLFIKVEECRHQLYRGRGSAERAAPVEGDGVESQLIARTPPECHGLTPEQYRDNVRWLEQAAESGVVMAQLSYARNAEAVIGNSSQMLANPEKVVAYRHKAMSYLHRAAASGSVEALLGLSDAYDYGVVTARDPMRAYAYYHAVGLNNPAYVDARLMDELASRLSPAQLGLATQQGRGIYDACCK